MLLNLKQKKIFTLKDKRNNNLNKTFFFISIIENYFKNNIF